MGVGLGKKFNDFFVTLSHLSQYDESFVGLFLESRSFIYVIDVSIPLQLPILNEIVVCVTKLGPEVNPSFVVFWLTPPLATGFPKHSGPFDNPMRDRQYLLIGILDLSVFG